MIRTIFIGDVHACYDELIALVHKICITPEDILYFVGDLVNKWPKSLEVVEYVRTRPNTYCVIWNHEHTELDNPQYIETRKILDIHGHTQWLKSLPHIIEDENFILVHGGLHPDMWVHTPVEIATMIRVYQWKPWYAYYTGEKIIVYWHWATEWLQIRTHTIWLDTWCCFGGFLTAYILETGDIYQERAHAMYAVPVNWRS
jgi:calcineurin-like phosphoesterase family protein